MTGSQRTQNMTSHVIAHAHIVRKPVDAYYNIDYILLLLLYHLLNFICFLVLEIRINPSLYNENMLHNSNIGKNIDVYQNNFP